MLMLILKVSKDLDLIQSDMKLQLGPRSKRFVLDALQRDVGFLSRHGLMDYSLLIAVEGIHIIAIYLLFMVTC